MRANETDRIRIEAKRKDVENLVCKSSEKKSGDGEV